jgi:signal peptidase I
MMMLDAPWKIAVLVSALVLFRIIVGAAKSMPNRPFFMELANSALIAFALVFLLVRPFLLQAFFIPSGSMEPTLWGDRTLHPRGGDCILVNKFIYRLIPPRRGDIIVFEAPEYALADVAATSGNREQGKEWIKRVIGLPGDRIQVKRDKGVYVNGQQLEEPYIREIPNYDFPADSYGNLSSESYTVPEGNLFVMGDNRNESLDSHAWYDPGPNNEFDPNTGVHHPELPMKNVLGRAMIRFWPLQRFGKLTK